jgi:hypothetical protein
MRVTTLSLLLLVVMGFAQDSASSKVDPGEQFKVKNGEGVVVRGEKLHIIFSSVFSESRCPDGAACVWVGNAAISVEVAKKNKTPVVAILNTLLEPKEIVYKGFKIKLIALDPHPKINEPIDPKDYVATMVVTKEE